MAFPHIEQEDNNRSNPKACSFSVQEVHLQIFQAVLINRKKNKKTKPTVKTCLKNRLQILINRVNATGF